MGKKDLSAPKGGIDLSKLTIDKKLYEAFQFICMHALTVSMSPEDVKRSFKLGAFQISVADQIKPPEWKTIKDSFWFHSMIPDYLYGIVAVESEHGERKAYLGKAEGNDMLVDQEFIITKGGAPITLSSIEPLMKWLKGNIPFPVQAYPEGGDPGDIISEKETGLLTWKTTTCADNDIIKFTSVSKEGDTFKINNDPKRGIELWGGDNWFGRFISVEAAKEIADQVVRKRV